MVELKSFFLAYIRSRSRFFAFILLLTGLIFLFDVISFFLYILDMGFLDGIATIS